MRVELHPLAAHELVEEALYLEERFPGLGERFIDEVEAAQSFLSNHPLAAAPLDSLFRQLPLRRFPLSLIYTVENDKLLVVAVAHQRRRPGYWRSRA